MKLNEIFLIRESSADKMQIAQTKKGTVRFIDNYGRVVCEIPFSALLKFSDKTGLDIMKKMIPQDPTEL